MVKVYSSDCKWDVESDLVAIGSSSGGLVSAIVGHDLGLKTVVLEKTDYLGGATAYSGGAIWIPCNHHMHEAGLPDSLEEAMTYVRTISMGRHDEESLAAYLHVGPKMIRYIEERTLLKMTIDPRYPWSADYYAEMPGGKSLGRKLMPDSQHMPERLGQAEKLHPLLRRVRNEPAPYSSDVRKDAWLFGRALIGPLVLACQDRGVPILTNARARELVIQDGRVIGVRADHDGHQLLVKGERGILLASGGFEGNEEMCRRFVNSPGLHSMTPPGNEGDGQLMGMEVGAALALMDHGIFMPTIHMTGEEAEGKPCYRPVPHGFPGMLFVNRFGKRCCNESFYPDIGRAFLVYDKVRSEFSNAPLFWIGDQSLKDRVPIGNLRRGVAMADWIHKGESVQELAVILGLPADTLAETVERFNHFAREGIDPDFHRGEKVYEARWGMRLFPDYKPNPALGPVEKPPFYGFQTSLGTVGNLGGLVVNRHAQVMNVHGNPIPGLYGTSNATALLSMGFTYDSGCSQGKSMIFGYIAARHMSGSDTLP